MTLSADRRRVLGCLLLVALDDEKYGRGFISAVLPPDVSSKMYARRRPSLGGCRRRFRS